MMTNANDTLYLNRVPAEAGISLTSDIAGDPAIYCAGCQMAALIPYPASLPASQFNNFTEEFLVSAKSSHKCRGHAAVAA